jgi:histidine triad (HIT) family protein
LLTGACNAAKRISGRTGKWKEATNSAKEKLWKGRIRQMDCIFCKIVKGELPAKKVYEDEHVVAFHDINPVAPVHVLAIPKKHITSLLDIQPEDKELIGHLHLSLQKVAAEMGVQESGFRVITNTGQHGQQTVFHIHYHLIGGRQLEWKM